MSPSRTLFLFVVFWICIAGVAVAVAARIKQAGETAAVQPVFVENPTVSEAPQSVDSSFYQGAPAAPAPQTVPATSSAPAVLAPSAVAADAVSAESYLVGDVLTGQIYLQKDPTDVLPVASMSKLITAITATDLYASTTTFEVTQDETEVPADPSDLQPGERFTETELLYPLLLDSSNVAAEALASSTDRAAFLEAMSSYAWEIGMSTAYFGDPSGLSAHNEASADDFFALAKYLYHSRPDILAITRIAHISIATTTDHGAHTFDSIQPFVNDPRFLGGKTGFTNAAQDTMLTILDIDSHPIAFIVLRSDDRVKDTQLLIDKMAGLL